MIFTEICIELLCFNEDEVKCYLACWGHWLTLNKTMCANVNRQLPCPSGVAKATIGTGKSSVFLSKMRWKPKIWIQINSPQKGWTLKCPIRSNWNHDCSVQLKWEASPGGCCCCCCCLEGGKVAPQAWLTSKEGLFHPWCVGISPWNLLSAMPPTGNMHRHPAIILRTPPPKRWEAMEPPVIREVGAHPQRDRLCPTSNAVPVAGSFGCGEQQVWA